MHQCFADRKTLWAIISFIPVSQTAAHREDWKKKKKLSTVIDGCTGSHENKTTVSCHCMGKSVDENETKNPILKNIRRADYFKQGEHGSSIWTVLPKIHNVEHQNKLKSRKQITSFSVCFCDATILCSGCTVDF